jgi:hypothetical protein
MNKFVGTEVVRSRKTHKVVGYDSVIGVFFPESNSLRVQIATAVNGGIIVARVQTDFDPPNVVFHGPIIRGTGKFTGATGSLTAEAIDGRNQSLETIHYVVHQEVFRLPHPTSR